jgi:hypothetical protein
MLTETCALDGFTLRAAASTARHPASTEVLIRSAQRTRDGTEPWTQHHGQQNGQRDRDADHGIDDSTTSRAFKPTHLVVTLGPRCPPGKAERDEGGGPFEIPCRRPR